MNEIINTIGLTKKVKNKRIVSNINLQVNIGEIYSLLGQNGVGKTTILKMLTGVMHPTIGEIRLFGHMLSDKNKEVLKRVGSIIEYPIFYESLTALENLKIHCSYLGYYDSEGIKHALELVQLDGSETTLVKNFSLGMKQRLGLARAIITKPELIILDEPTNGLDPLGIKLIRDLILMLNKDYGITFLISSHILGEIEQVADRIGVIHEGTLWNEVILEDLRKKRTEYLELVTNQVEQAAFLLDKELQISNFKIMNENTIRIYDLSKSQNKISKMLIMRDVDIEELKKHNSSLEDFFYEQVNGCRQIG